MSVITRADHLVWCKQRALEYVNMGDVTNAFSSMVSDMRKHPDTENHATLELGFMMMLSGHLDSAEKMRKFIEGFN